MRLTGAKLRAARARIAAVVAGALPPEELGEIRLRHEQRLAVARVADSFHRYGGALLADEVGRGKTFVALAVARRWTRPLVVAPASLRDTWEQAMRRTGVVCAFVTHESLSRGRRPDIAPDGVIVDESHRFRSTTAQRHRTLADLTARVPVLLMSATPLQNRPRDLAAQLAIFLGVGTFSLGVEALARLVIRIPLLSASTLPAVVPPQWIALDADDGAVLRAILALPPPPRAIDAGDGGVLRTIVLVRAWSSSRAALGRMIERRRSVATAIEQSVADGVWPSRRELRSWYAGEGTTQLGFASLLAGARIRGAQREALLRTAAAERDGLDRIHREVHASPDPDVSRVAALRALRDAFPDARLLAFSELASTVRAYWSALRGDAAVGILTSHEARIASGRLARAELLARFAPLARGAPAPHEREAVTLLLTTDLLSEGVNLQDASVIVHLDLPWNPARLAQRVGRVRRLGGSAKVHTFLMPPPASTELLLRVEARLRGKLATAERTIGRDIPVMPALGFRPLVDPRPDAVAISADALGETYARIAGWRRADGRSRGCGPTRPIIAAVVAPRDGWLAALDSGRLLASIGGAPPDDVETPIEVIGLAAGSARPLRTGEGSAAQQALGRWLDVERLARDCGLDPSRDHVTKAYEHRVAREIARTARHELATVAGMAQRLRDLLRCRRSLGTDRALLAHLRTPCMVGGVFDWVQRAITLATPPNAASTVWDAPSGLAALVVFGPL